MDNENDSKISTEKDPSATSDQRKNTLLIEKRFQTWFILSLLGYTACFLTVFSVSVLVWYRLILKEFVDISSLLSPTLVTHLQTAFRSGVILFSFINLSLLAVTAYFALRFSRRIAGPLFAIARQLDRSIKTGTWEPVKLRQDDLFQDLALKLNHALDDQDVVSSIAKKKKA